MKLNVSVAIAFLIFLSSSRFAYALHAKDQQVFLDQLSDYSNCQSKDYSGEWCHDALVRWVKAHPADAFAAGKLTRANMNAWGALPFFVQAFDAKKGDCKDEDVKLAVLDGLDLSAKYNESVVAMAKKVGFSACANELQNAINEAAVGDGETFKNSCKELSSKGLLTGLRKKKCENLK